MEPTVAPTSQARILPETGISCNSTRVTCERGHTRRGRRRPGRVGCTLDDSSATSVLWARQPRDLRALRVRPWRPTHEPR